MSKAAPKSRSKLKSPPSKPANVKNRPRLVDTSSSDDVTLDPEALYSRRQAQHPRLLPVSEATMVRLEKAGILTAIKLDPTARNATVYYSGADIRKARSPKHL